MSIIFDTFSERREVGRNITKLGVEKSFILNKEANERIEQFSTQKNPENHTTY